MAGKQRTPVFTENFSCNLDAIRLFLEPEGRAVFERLFNRLSDNIVPMLCRYSQSGRIFLQHPVRSKDARLLLRKLGTFLKKGGELREFVADDYLVLYLLRGTRIFFLSIKHHRQLSYDLRRFWL